MVLTQFPRHIIMAVDQRSGLEDAVDARFRCGVNGLGDCGCRKGDQHYAQRGRDGPGKGHESRESRTMFACKVGEAWAADEKFDHPQS